MSFDKKWSWKSNNMIYYTKDYMARCGDCGKKFKIRKRTEHSCFQWDHPSQEIPCTCGNILHPGNTHILDDDYNDVNLYTHIFFNEEKQRLVLSFSMDKVYAPKGDVYYPVFGEEHMGCRFKITMDVKKGTTVCYYTKLRKNQKRDMIERMFHNITSLSGSSLPYQMILLGKEAKEVIFHCLGVDASEEEFSLYDLPWVNRLKTTDQKRINWERYVRSHFGGMDLRVHLSNDEPGIGLIKKHLDTKRIDGEKVVEKINMRFTRRMSQYYKTGHKVKGYDKDLFAYMCAVQNVDADDVPKKIIRDYYENPWAIPFFYQQRLLFGSDINIWRNAINAIQQPDVSATNCHRLFGSGISRDDCRDDLRLLEMQPKTIHYYLGKPKHYYKKFVNATSYIYLKDTITMMQNALEDEGIPIDRKGTIRDIHDRYIRMSRWIRLPNDPFPNIENDKPVTIDDITFYRPTSAKELGKIGEEMNLCVGSYWKLCRRNSIQIIVGVKKGVPVCCLEIRGIDDDEDREDFGWVLEDDEEIKNPEHWQLVQAKGEFNKYIDYETQKKFLQYLMEKEVMITPKIRDIDEQAYRDLIKERKENHIMKRPA